MCTKPFHSSKNALTPFYVQHDRWEPNPYLGYPNDIALLRLTEPADLEWPGVELACIANDVNFNFTNEECWITGWGKTYC